MLRSSRWQLWFGCHLLLMLSLPASAFSQDTRTMIGRVAGRIDIVTGGYSSSAVSADFDVGVRFFYDLSGLKTRVGPSVILIKDDARKRWICLEIAPASYGGKRASFAFYDMGANLSQQVEVGQLGATEISEDGLGSVRVSSQAIIKVEVSDIYANLEGQFKDGYSCMNRIFLKELSLGLGGSLGCCVDCKSVRFCATKGNSFRFSSSGCEGACRYESVR